MAIAFAHEATIAPPPVGSGAWALMTAVGITLDAAVGAAAAPPVWRGRAPAVARHVAGADALQCERMFVALHTLRHDAWRLAAAARVLRQPLAGLGGVWGPREAPAARAATGPAGAAGLATLCDVVADGVARARQPPPPR